MNKIKSVIYLEVRSFDCEIDFNGILYLCKVPKITDQYIGSGYSIDEAKSSALDVIKELIK